jgi:flavin-dependent dehydrogenase
MSNRVVIIGAGPAGSATAILLARGGMRVTLIEQHRFPRDKVCGECLSAVGIAVLNRLGLSAGVKQLGPVVFTHTAIHTPEGPSVNLPLPRAMWGISRSKLDAFLLDSALRSGVTILQPARCEAIESGATGSVSMHACGTVRPGHAGDELLSNPDKCAFSSVAYLSHGRDARATGEHPDRSDATPAVRLRMLDSNRIVTLAADHIIVADGKGSLLRDIRPTGDFGIKAHFEQIDGPRDTIELFGCNGLYGGLAAIEDGRWNAAFSVPAVRLKEHRGNIAAVFARIVRENPVLDRRVSGARQASDWLAAPLPRFGVRNHWPAGIMPAGNAAAALEPIGGEGMGLALLSAEQLARSLLAGRTTPLVGEYRRLWRVRRASCRAAAVLVSQPTTAAIISPLLRTFPPLGRVGLRLLGK